MADNTLKDGRNVVKQAVHLAEVERYGKAIVVPEQMAYPTAAEILLRKAKEEEEKVNYSEVIPVFPWEGALAFKKATEQLYGIPSAGITWSHPFFGTMRPSEIQVETGPGTKVSVPWGKFSFMGAEDGEYLMMDTGQYENTMAFAINGVIKRKHLDQIRELVDLTRHIAITESIYRGKAIRMEFSNDAGQALPWPNIRFFDIKDVDLKEMIYNSDIESILEANVFNHLRDRAILAKIGVPFKMGVLLAGDYGTGKSLYARAVAKVATDAGVTFVYLKRPSDLAKALDFGMRYQPVVVFTEDVDRIIGEDRTDEVNQIVNILDGIDSKGAQVMTILTTNHLGKINKVLLRPGRIDLAIKIERPDADAISRLIKLYGRGVIDHETDVSEASRVMVGHTPATIREVVERAKRLMVARTHSVKGLVETEDVTVAAKTVVQQAKLIEGDASLDEKSGAEMFFDDIVAGVTEEIEAKLQDGGLKGLDGVAENLGWLRSRFS